ncbi:hypothetical protein EI94DRAFT_394783 [Lactarius quietus]|nr:hypothetical protein EI94DRAFT_394783 [Lactarius quietus]
MARKGANLKAFEKVARAPIALVRNFAALFFPRLSCQKGSHDGAFKSVAFRCAPRKALFTLPSSLSTTERPLPYSTSGVYSRALLEPLAARIRTDMPSHNDRLLLLPQVCGMAGLALFSGRKGHPIHRPLKGRSDPVNVERSLVVTLRRHADNWKSQAVGGGGSRWGRILIYDRRAVRTMPN